VAMIRERKQDGKRTRRRRRRLVRIGAPDPSLTPAAGVEAVRELDRALSLARTLDDHIGPVKQRARGLSAGQLLVSLASAMLAGADHLVGLDRRRQDLAGQRLEPVPTPPSTTAGGIARRFTPDRLAGIEQGLGAVVGRWLSLLPGSRRATLPRRATIDGDSTDVEVYGRAKRGAAHTYNGALALRSHIAFWAEPGSRWPPS